MRETKCVGCGKTHTSHTKRFDHLMYLLLSRRHAKGPMIVGGWVCNEVCAARALMVKLPYLCDRCDQPATVSTWFRLRDTDVFVRTKRCDDHPFELPDWVLALRRPPRRPTHKRVT